MIELKVLHRFVSARAKVPLPLKKSPSLSDSASVDQSAIPTSNAEGDQSGPVDQLGDTSHMNFPVNQATIRAESVRSPLVTQSAAERPPMTAPDGSQSISTVDAELGISMPPSSHPQPGVLTFVNHTAAGYPLNFVAQQEADLSTLGHRGYPAPFVAQRQARLLTSGSYNGYPPNYFRQQQATSLASGHHDSYASELMSCQPDGFLTADYYGGYLPYSNTYPTSPPSALGTCDDGSTRQPSQPTAGNDEVLDETHVPSLPSHGFESFLYPNE
jgi:hypothetical protein